MRTSKPKSQALRRMLPLVALALAVTACDCGGGGPVAALPDFSAQPAAVSFESCPSMDENNQAVEDVFPDRQTFTLQNLGRGTGTVVATITGKDADRFKLVAETVPEVLGAGESAEITVEFIPTAKGDAVATLEIDDGDDQTEELVRVTLIGTGTNLPSQPTLKVSYESAPGSGEYLDCEGGVFCQLAFPHTFHGQESRLRVKVRNEGCPTLKVTALDVQRTSIGGGTQLFYFLDRPAVPPSSANPALLTLADQTQEMELELRFAPEDDGEMDGQRYAILTIQTNDPVQDPTESLPGVRKLSLTGLAAAPAIYASPSFCDFTSDADLCGGTKVPTTGNDKAAVFQVTNGGNVDVVIQEVRMVAPHSGRFSFGATNPAGMTLADSQSLPLEIRYTDAATYVTDVVQVVAVTGDGQPAGDAFIRVSGGILPQLYTDPPVRLDFSDATTLTSTKPVQICNRAGAGTLVVDKVWVIQSPQFFKVKQGPPAGAQVEAGQCVTAEVEFTRPVSGGILAGTLEIQTNDPNYAATSWHRVGLYSEVPVDELPVAVLKGPNLEENTFTVKLSELGPVKRVILRGSESYDPPTNVPVAHYEYWLKKKPQAATSTLTLDDGATLIEGIKTLSDTVELNVDGAKTGEYQVVLIVYDSAGQKSANAAELKIWVSP